MIKQHTQSYLNEIKQVLDNISLEDIEKIVNIIHDAYQDNKHIFIMGNGGSAATASHFACDLGKGTLHPTDSRRIQRFKVTALTDNVALMTAWSNDSSYDNIFSEQLKNLLSEGDVVIGISASGNSRNILNAINVAKEYRAITIGFIGFDGGDLVEIVDASIVARVNRYDIAEDIHLMLTHIITRYFLELLLELEK